jgi:OFA family oxalate/formate antiporter-like MFS transporter
MSRDARAMLAVLGCSVAIFWPGALNFGFPGVMAPVWQEMFHVGRGTIGNTIFFMLAAVGIFMFLVGRWQERYGTRRMIIAGVVLCGLCVVLVAYAKSVVVIYVWAFLTGLSTCFVYIPALTTVQRWYPKRKGLVSGIVSMVFGLSAAIMSPLFERMLTTLGYERMNLTIAFLTIAFGLLGACFSFEEDAKSAEERTISFGDRSSADRDDGLIPPGWELWTRSLTVQESLHTRSFWFLWITWALAGAAGVTMVTLSTAWGLSRGYALDSAILILTAFNLTNGAGRLFSGYFSDIVGRNGIMSAAFFAAGLAYFALPWSDSLFASAVLASVVGFAFGTLFAVSAPLVADCFGLKHFGAIFGLAFAAYGFVAGPLGPTLSGYLLDATGDDFFLVFLYLGVFCILSGLFVGFVKPPGLKPIAIARPE